ncbi:MAG: hypothetical protein K5839_06980, partial [Treponemataceae bacterium]|nr:hypothetical protein [Treponemataceae bacterium]
MMKIMNIRKSVLVFFLLISSVFTAFAGDFYIGSGAEGKRYAVFEPSLTNVGAGESSWIGKSVRDSFNTSLKQYTGMTSVDVANTAKIKEYQKKSESGAMDEATAIELGKLVNAQYGVFINITKTASTYMLSVSVTDLTTGTQPALYTVKDVRKVNDLYGISANQVILHIVPQLGVELTSMGKYSLNNNTDDISVSQQAELAQQEADNLKRQAEKL